MSFKDQIHIAMKEKGANIVLALDVTDTQPLSVLKRSLTILRDTQHSICAVKINLQTLILLGLEGVKKIIREAHNFGLPVIMDCKMNDVGNSNVKFAEVLFNVGFDALIANPFVGWKGALQPVFELSRREGKGVILLVYMSHPGADEGYGQIVLDPSCNKPTPQYRVFAEKALRWGADGAVVGATRPEKVGEVYEILREEVPIYSPGVGVQGGSAIEALKAGASYLIIGRSIIMSNNPERTVKRFKEEIGEFLKL